MVKMNCSLMLTVSPMGKASDDASDGAKTSACFEEVGGRMLDPPARLQEAAMSKHNDVISVAHLARVQVLRGVQRSQEITLGAARVMVKAAGELPVKDLPAPSKLPGVPSLDAATRFTFDFATELLNSGRDFATRLSTVLNSR